jgi:hypothetical protein
LRKGNHLEELGVDRKIILKCILEKWDWGREWSGLSLLRIGPGGWFL